MVRRKSRIDWKRNITCLEKVFMSFPEDRRNLKLIPCVVPGVHTFSYKMNKFLRPEVHSIVTIVNENEYLKLAKYFHHMHTKW